MSRGGHHYVPVARLTEDMTVSVTQTQNQIEGMVRVILSERIPERLEEYDVIVPVPPTMEEATEVIEFAQECIVKEINDVPVPYFQRK